MQEHLFYSDVARRYAEQGEVGMVFPRERIRAGAEGCHFTTSIPVVYVQFRELWQDSLQNE